MVNLKRKYKNYPKCLDGKNSLKPKFSIFCSKIYYTFAYF